MVDTTVNNTGQYLNAEGIGTQPAETLEQNKEKKTKKLQISAEKEHVMQGGQLLMTFYYNQVCEVYPGFFKRDLQVWL